MLALLLWSISLIGSNVQNYELVPGLSPLFWVAFFLLTASFVLNILTKRSSNWILLAHVVAAVLILYVSPIAIERTPRTTSGYVHWGAAEYILRYGHAIPEVSVYHQWPPALHLGAALGLITDASDASLLMFTPLFSQSILYLFAVAFLVKQLSVTRKETWLIFYLFTTLFWNINFFGLRSYGYLVLLLVLGLLLKLELRNFPQQFGLRVVLVLSLVCLAMSHGLIAFAALIQLGALIIALALVTRRRHLNSLVLYMCLLGMHAMSTAYLSVFQPLQGWIRSALTFDIFYFARRGLVEASAAHVLMVRLRTIGMIAFAGLGILGGVCQWFSQSRKRTELMIAAALVLGSAMSVLLGAYYGETLWMAFALGLVPLAFLGAKGLDGRIRRIPLIIFLLASPFISMVGLYEGEQLAYIPPGEIRGVDFSLQNLPNDGGSIPVSICGNTRILKYRDIEKTTVITDEQVEDMLEASLKQDAGSPSIEADYIILSKGWESAYPLKFADPDLLLELEHIANSTFSLVYSNTELSLYAASSAR